VFSSGPHGGAAHLEPSTIAIRDLYMPLFRKHHVGLIIAGHDHLFDHWVERYADKNGRKFRIDQVITGGGGAPIYVYGSEPDLRGYLTSTASDGVTFELRVDGEVVKRRPVQPGARWTVLLAPLAAYAGRKVELELAIDPRETTAGDAALVGWPRLFHGYERSPLQVWAEEREER